LKRHNRPASRPKTDRNTFAAKFFIVGSQLALAGRFGSAAVTRRDDMLETRMNTGFQER
jgi:hypothetical protein